MSGVSLLTAEDDVCKEAGRDLLTVLSDFAPDTQFMGQEIGYTPFELLDVENSTEEKPVVNGFDVQVAAQIAHRLGFKRIKFQQTFFNEILDSIVGEVNTIGVSAISITTERQDNENPAFVKYNEDSMAIILLTTDVNNNLRLKNPDTVLDELNKLAGDGETRFEFVNTTIGSRQDKIVGFFNDGGPYNNLQTATFDRLSVALEFLDPSIDRLSLFTDTATANDLKSKGLINNFTVISPVTFDNSGVAEDQDSQGLGIAIRAECCQLYADIAKAIKVMIADGTLARLRDQFNIGNSFAPLDDLTPPACAGTQSDINNNPVSNFLFTKHCAGPVEAILS